MNIQNLVLDINKKPFQTITANVGEVASRFVKISIVDKSIPVDLTGVTVSIYAKKPDGKKVFNNVTIEDKTNGIILAELTSQILAVEGLVKLTLLLVKNDSKLCSKQFLLNVDSTIVDDTAIESTNEFTALTTALGKVNNIDSRFESINSSLDNMENNQNVLTNFILGKQLLNGHGTKIGINNTIQAYEFLANTKCYDMLEADVHCTIDGVWVCTHDDDISINTNGIGLISQMTFETTQIVDVVNGGNNINKFPKMKIPKLEDFINICLQYSLVPMIEIKCSMTNEKYNSLSTLIRRLGVENKVIITAYNQNVIQELRKMTNATLLWLIPSDRDISDSDITFAKNLGKCGLGGYQYKLTKPQIEKCKENNVFTYIWTITQQFELEIAKEMGANIIGSDNVLRG